MHVGGIGVMNWTKDGMGGSRQGESRRAHVAV